MNKNDIRLLTCNNLYFPNVYFQVTFSLPLPLLLLKFPICAELGTWNLYSQIARLTLGDWNESILMREETGVPGGNPRSQVEID